MKLTSDISVAEVMNEKIVTISKQETVANALKLMKERNISSLIVMRRDESDEHGIVVVSDIASGVIAQNLSPNRVNIADIMSKPVLTLSADMQARFAVSLLLKLGLSRAIVVDGARNPLGIATLRDLVIAYVDS